MTSLRKPVVRTTVGECQAVRRRLVIALEPGDVLAIREHGRRRWYRAPISRVFMMVARWNIDAERAEKRKNGRAGK